MHQNINNSVAEVLVEVVEIGLKLFFFFKFLNASSYICQIIVALVIVHQRIRIDGVGGVVSGHVVKRGLRDGFFSFPAIRGVVGVLWIVGFVIVVYAEAIAMSKH